MQKRDFKHLSSLSSFAKIISNSTPDYQCTMLQNLKYHFATCYNFRKSIHFCRLSPFTRLTDSTIS